jgi:hypothetical protein
LGADLDRRSDSKQFAILTNRRAGIELMRAEATRVGEAQPSHSADFDLMHYK